MILKIIDKCLPAGYLRCDGSVLFAEYPFLAEVLGVGDSSRYKKPDTTLANKSVSVA